MQSCLYYQVEAESRRLYESGEGDYSVSFDSDRTFGAARSDRAKRIAEGDRALALAKRWSSSEDATAHKRDEVVHSTHSNGATFTASRDDCAKQQYSSAVGTLAESGREPAIGQSAAPEAIAPSGQREAIGQSAAPKSIGQIAPAKPSENVTSEPSRGSRRAESLMLRSPSELQATLKTFQQALATAQAKNNRVNQVNILKRIGLIHCKLEEYAWGIKCLQQALELAQSMENQVSIGVILNYLGAAYRQTGQEQKALRVYLRALEIIKDIGNEAGVALLLNHLGAVYNSLGQTEQALSCSRQALETFHELGNSPEGEGNALHNIGEVYLQMRRYRQALAFFEQALSIYQKIGNGKGEAKVLESIATACVRVNQNQQALELYQQALEIRRKVGDSSNTEARSFDYIGAVHYKMGNRSRALWYHLQALGFLQAHHYTAGIERFGDDTATIKKLLQNLVPVYDRLGLHAQGVKCYQEAVEIIKTFGENACEEAIGNFFAQEGSLSG